MAGEAMTALSIVQDIAQGLRFPRPAIALTSQDLKVQLIVAAMQEAGKQTMERHDWQALIVQHTVATIAAEVQTSALPSDYDRLVYGTDIWNRSTNQKYTGPTDPGEWGYFKSAAVTAGVPGWWRIIADKLNIFPAPSAGQTLAFEYVSKNWAKKADGTDQDKFLLDTDLPRIPERQIILGGVWIYKYKAGLDYGEDLSTYERSFEARASRDRGAGVVRRRHRSEWRPPTWPGTVTP